MAQAGSVSSRPRPRPTASGGGPGGRVCGTGGCDGHGRGAAYELGSVLAAETLTVASPFLNSSGNQGKYGIRDEVYERIPQQILSLLKEDEPCWYEQLSSAGNTEKDADQDAGRSHRHPFPGAEHR